MYLCDSIYEWYVATVVFRFNVKERWAYRRCKILYRRKVLAKMFFFIFLTSIHNHDMYNLYHFKSAFVLAFKKYKIIFTTLQNGKKVDMAAFSIPFKFGHFHFYLSKIVNIVYVYSIYIFRISPLSPC